MCEYCNEPYKNMSVREGISKSENQNIHQADIHLCRYKQWRIQRGNTKNNSLRKCQMVT